MRKIDGKIVPKIDEIRAKSCVHHARVWSEIYFGQDFISVKIQKLFCSNGLSLDDFVSRVICCCKIFQTIEFEVVK